MREELELAREDDEIAALLLRIDSPGGTVIASEMLYREVRRFKERDEAAGGRPDGRARAPRARYYVAMAADEVRAYPSTVTGSIGVIIAGLNVSGLMEQLRRREPDPHERRLQGHRLAAPADAARRSARSSRAWCDDLFASFLEVVAGRAPEAHAARASSSSPTAASTARSQALEAGLVDAIGDLPDAVEAAKKRRRNRRRRARRRLPPAGRGAREPVLGSGLRPSRRRRRSTDAAARPGVPLPLVAGRGTTARLSRPSSRPGSGRSR